MFPTIFSLAIEELEEYKPEGSGILCTAIVGGAFIPPAVGGLTDAYGFGIAFLLPALCYIYIAFYARRVGQ
jgi:FHS family L-fucose permease-like MFS transporter